MNLDDLDGLGGFVSPDPIAKKVVWKRLNPDFIAPEKTDSEGEVQEELEGQYLEDEFTVHIKLLSYGLIESIINVDSKNPTRSVNAGLISEAVLFGADPFESLTYEKAFQLENGLARALVAAINEVNGRAKPKNSQPPTNSGKS